MRYVLGIDIGGTNLVVGSVAEDGSALHALATEPTHAEAGASDVVDRLVALAERAIAATRREVPGADIVGVGVGRARARSTPNAASSSSRPNLGWVNLPLRQIIARRASAFPPRSTTTPTAPCWANGGSARPAARGTPSASPSAPASAAGIILDGKLYHGASDVAGEIGHTTIDTEGRRCKCGNYGCLEAYASGPNIALRAIEAIEAGAESRLPSYVGGDLRRSPRRRSTRPRTTATSSRSRS